MQTTFPQRDIRHRCSEVSDTRRLVVIDARGYFTRGGIGRYTRNLVDHLLRLPDSGIRFRILLAGRHTPAEIGAAVSDGVEIARSRADWPTRGWDAGLPADEVDGAALFHSLSGRWLPDGTRNITTVHDLTPMVYPELVPDVLRWHCEAACGGVARAKSVITVSASTAIDVRRLLGVEPHRITVVPEAADARFFPRHVTAQSLARFNVAAGRFFLCVSSFWPHKNLLRLVEAYDRSDVTDPLLIVGANTGERDTISNEIRRRGLDRSVRLVRPVSDQTLARLYSACRVFVYPSLYESFGLPVLEAMACGAPVICSNTSALPEVAGRAAILVDPERVDDIAGAIATLDADATLRARLSARAHLRAGCFAWDTAARATLGIYHAVLQEAA